jgi:hypothetical protein
MLFVMSRKYVFSNVHIWIEDGSIELRLDWFLVRSIQYNPLSRDGSAAASKPRQQQQQAAAPPPRKQQGQYNERLLNFYQKTLLWIGSIFNKIRPNQNRPAGNVGALRRRMLAAQHALSRATKTLAAMPRLKQQRQRFLQQPQQLVNDFRF